MALPTLRGTAVVAQNTSAVTSFSINAPTGISDGDIWAVFVNTQAAGVNTTTPTGFTLHKDSGADAQSVRTYLFWKKWTLGDSTSVTVNMSGAGSAYGSVSCAFIGAHQVAPFGTTVATSDQTNDTTLDVGALTTIGTDSLSIVAGGIGSNSTTFTVQPSGYTEIQVATGKRISVGYANRAAAGTISASSYTISAAIRGWTFHVELFSPISFPSLTLDNFNRGNASISGQTASDGLHTWATASISGGTVATTISSNKIVQSAAPSPADCYLTQSFAADCDVFCTVATVPSAGGYVFLAARIKDEGTSGWDGYGLIYIVGTGWQLRRYDNGTSTALGATVSGSALSNGDRIALRIRGSDISAYIYTGGVWTVVLTRTDSTYTNAGRIGFEFDGGSALDDFSGSDAVPVEITDNFNRADNASLGANWPVLSGATSQAISSRAVVSNSSGNYRANYLNSLLGADQYAQVTLVNWSEPNNLKGVHLYLRVQDPAGSVKGVIDDFNRTNNSNLGSNWTQVTSISTNRLAIVSNQAKPPGSDCADAYTAAIYGADQEVSVTLGTIDTGSSHTWLLLQMPNPSAGSFTGYLLDIVATGTCSIALYRGNAGSYTTLISTVGGFPYNAGDVWTLRKVGSSLGVFRNGSLVANSVTDSSPLTAPGYIGIGSNGSGTLTLDNFSGGSNPVGWGGYKCHFLYNVGGFDTWVIEKFAGGMSAGYPAFGDNVPTRFTSGDVIRAKAVGTTIALERWIPTTGWQLLGSATDSTYTGGGYVALSNDLTNADSIDDFVAVSFSTTGTLTPIAIAAGLTLTSVLSNQIIRPKALVGSVTFTAAFQKTIPRTLAVGLTAIPVILGLHKIYRTLAVTLTATPVISGLHKIYRTIAASLIVGQAMSFAKSKFLTLAATIVNTNTLTQKGTYYKTLAASITITPVIVRKQMLQKTLAANVTLTAQRQLVRMGRITLAGNLPLTGIVVKRSNKVLNSVVNLAGAVQVQKFNGGFVSRTLTAGLQLQAGLVATKVIKKAITGALFLDTIIQRRKLSPIDWNDRDWLIDAKSLDTPKLDGARLDEAVLERTIL